MPPSEETLFIGPATTDSYVDALGLVFGQFEPQQAAEYVRIFAQAIRDGKLPLEGVIEARQGNRLIGAVVCQVQSGRTAVVWPPRVVAGTPAGMGSRLLNEVVHGLSGKNVRLASALLTKEDPRDEEVFLAAGFAHLTDLLYLVSTIEEFPFSGPSTPLDFEPYRPEIHSRLASIVQATYVGSLDCPQLDGVRDVNDVLAGYRDTGEFSPERWLVVRHEGRDVGCLLLADHPQEDTWELVYMGLIAAVRGRGWGKWLVRQAQWLTRQAGRSRLVVAVDAANGPAIELYGASGFRGWDQRRVYAMVFPERRPPEPTAASSPSACDL
jgi:ribosomal protein S18 acetylase RimI-like enzyme